MLVPRKQQQKIRFCIASIIATFKWTSVRDPYWPRWFPAVAVVVPVYPHGYLAAGIAERNADVSHRPTCLLVKHNFNLLKYQGYVEEM